MLKAPIFEPFFLSFLCFFLQTDRSNFHCSLKQIDRSTRKTVDQQQNFFRFTYIYQCIYFVSILVHLICLKNVQCQMLKVSFFFFYATQVSIYHSVKEMSFQCLKVENLSKYLYFSI